MTTALEKKLAIEKGYDTIANEYLAWSAPRPTTTRMEYIAQLMALLPAKAEILELGCGAGVPATQVLVAHEKQFAVTGNDISAAQLALARTHVPGAKGFLHGDMLQLEFADGALDAVVGFYAIFHLPASEQREMIRKIHGWLKPGGYLLVNFDCYEGAVVREGWFKPEVTMYQSGLGVEGTRTVFKELEGFKMVVDKVDVEMVGRFEEKFHWIMAQKEA
ncbi:S-adenosyl-L-methionine-dependent methyltransferase [Mycena kentingensis (nom. inval.)]|nr:S-adenosyl-L-methionine-dependent methyltransferase [Mycena kentingensis (nom. inval.)]